MDIFRLARKQSVQEELAGRQEVRMTFWSFVPAIHDGLVGVKGHLFASIAAAKQLRALGVRVWVDIPLCKSNIATLDALLNFVVSFGVQELCIVFPEQKSSSLLPRLELVQEYLQKLPKEVLKRCTFRGFPCCVLPTVPVSTRIDNGVFLPACDVCAVRSSCGGVPKHYLEVYGQVDMKPIHNA